MLKKLFAFAMFALTTAPRGGNGGGGGGDPNYVPISLSYKSSSMRKAKGVRGFMPPGAGPFPLFVYVTGTSLSYWNADDELYVKEMVDRGFAAVSVDYPTRSRYPGNCDSFTNSVRSVYSSADSGSAVNVVNSLDEVDISLGIVSSGFSQGANHAVLARNFNTNVKAAYGTGNGYTNWGLTCYTRSYQDLPQKCSRQVIGSADTIWGRDQATMQEQITGYADGDCASATDCRQADGSGWYLVASDELADGENDHCFQYGAGFCDGTPLDANFRAGPGWWALEASFDWLSTFGNNCNP